MRLETSDGRTLWLAYGMNVHAGGDAQTTLAAIDACVLPLRERLGVRGPFGLALRLGADGAERLLADDRLRARLRERLRAHDLVVFTGNAFVHGAFHGRPLKDDVYRPPWSDPRRAQYTLTFAKVLADLAAPGVAISLSTAPLAFKAWGSGAQELRAGAAQLVACAEGLRRLEERTGVRVVLGLEPEPGCLLETTAETRSFFRGPLADALEGAPALRPYLGACYDVCHQAVEWEEPEANLEGLLADGIPIAKVQASCALELPDPTDADGRAALAAFDEPVYLHQVGARDAAGRLHVAADLSEALRDRRWHARGPWRVHFHVPVFRAEALPPLRTTQPHLDRALRRVARGDVTTHLEIETYTWDVLPAAERAAGVGFDLVEALARETEYVVGVLRAAGARSADERS